MTYIVDHLGQMEPASSWLGLTRKQAEAHVRERDRWASQGAGLREIDRVMEVITDRIVARDVDRVVDTMLAVVIAGHLLPEDYV